MPHKLLNPKRDRLFHKNPFILKIQIQMTLGIQSQMHLLQIFHPIGNGIISALGSCIPQPETPDKGFLLILIASHPTMVLILILMYSNSSNVRVASSTSTNVPSNVSIFSKHYGFHSFRGNPLHRTHTNLSSTTKLSSHGIIVSNSSSNHSLFSSTTFLTLLMFPPINRM